MISSSKAVGIGSSILILLVVGFTKGCYHQQREHDKKKFSTHEVLEQKHHVQTLQERLNNVPCSYKTDNDTKAKGLRMKYDIPCQWHETNAGLPNTMKVFSFKENDNTFYAVSVTVRISDQEVSKSDIISAATEENFSRMASALGEYIGGAIIDADDLIGLEILIKSDNNIEGGGILHTYKMSAQLFYKKYIVDFTYSVGSTDINNASKKFEEYKPVFQKCLYDTKFLN